MLPSLSRRVPWTARLPGQRLHHIDIEAERGLLLMDCLRGSEQGQSFRASVHPSGCSMEEEATTACTSAEMGHRRESIYASHIQAKIGS